MNDERFATLHDFYRLFYNERRFEEGAERLTDDFANHHPGANGRGRRGMVDDFSRLGPGPAFRIEPVRMFADGDLVWVLSRTSGLGAGGLSVDLWRFQDGQIAEHWDFFRKLEADEDVDALLAGLGRR